VVLATDPYTVTDTDAFARLGVDETWIGGSLAWSA
jgi:hypothetical protein